MDKETIIKSLEWMRNEFDKTRNEIKRVHGHDIPEVEALRVKMGFEIECLINHLSEK
jgi:hypothetical protein